MDTLIKGDRIKALRKKFGYSQENVGDVLGISKQAVSEMEKGSRHLSEDKVCKLEKYFSVSRQYLTGDVDEWDKIKYDGRTLTIPITVDPYVAPAHKIIVSADKNQQEIMLFILQEYKKHDNLKPELIKSAIPFIFDFIEKADIEKIETIKRLANAI